MPFCFCPNTPVVLIFSSPSKYLLSFRICQCFSIQFLRRSFCFPVSQESLFPCPLGSFTESCFFPFIFLNMRKKKISPFLAKLELCLQSSCVTAETGAESYSTLKSQTAQNKSKLLLKTKNKPSNCNI